MVNSAAASANGDGSTSEFFEEVKLASHLFTGITDATMSQNEAWHFCRLGRLLERADKTSRILDVKYYILLRSVDDVGTPLDDIQWTAVLRSASAFEMYRKRHGRISPRGVVEFLMLSTLSFRESGPVRPFGRAGLAARYLRNAAGHLQDLP